MAKVTLTDDRSLTRLSDEELEIVIAETRAALAQRLHRQQQSIATEAPWIIVVVVLAFVVAWIFIFREWFAPVAPPQSYTQMRDNALAPRQSLFVPLDSFRL